MAKLASVGKKIQLSWGSSQAKIMLFSIGPRNGLVFRITPPKRLLLTVRVLDTSILNILQRNHKQNKREVGNEAGRTDRDGSLIRMFDREVEGEKGAEVMVTSRNKHKSK